MGPGVSRIKLAAFFGETRGARAFLCWAVEWSPGGKWTRETAEWEVCECVSVQADPSETVVRRSVKGSAWRCTVMSVQTALGDIER
jgi:hypothetical protein